MNGIPKAVPMAGGAKPRSYEGALQERASVKLLRDQIPSSFSAFL